MALPFPHYLFHTSLVFTLLVALACANETTPDPASLSDAAALLEFKRAVSSDPAGLLSGWTPWSASGSHHCQWYGVTCDASSGRVTALSLTGSTSSEFSGALPDSLASLTELRYLSLQDNAFSGEIPSSVLAGLRRLEVVELQGNNFSGGIPGEQVTGLTALRHFDLSRNSLSGPVPLGLLDLPLLEYIDLSRNRLSGEIPVPSVFPCRSLSYLRFSGNFLVGRIPPGLGNCSALETLQLDGNIFEGPIPAELGRLSALRVLDLSHNSLTERIPAELGGCRNLSILILTNLAEGGPGGPEEAEFNAFVGSIPPALLGLPRLEVLWAPRANLGGRLPRTWGAGGSCVFKALNLGQNYLRGDVPDQLFTSCQRLLFLDLSSNNFTGQFPELPISVGCIRYLNLSGNSMSGPLPHLAVTSCGDSASSDDVTGPYLDTLVRSQQSSSSPSGRFGLVHDEKSMVLHDFSWNSFAGPLPSFHLQAVSRRYSYGLFLNGNRFNGSFPGELFAGCKDLQSFSVDLSDNMLSGEIETGSFSGCQQLGHLAVANNQLNGALPSSFSDQLRVLDLSENNLTGDIPEDLVTKLSGLECLVLGDNGLVGHIPVQIGDMSFLTVLNLSKNALTGSIPVSLVNATKLQVLLLHHNYLTGSIPQVFTKFDRLVTLDVSFNNLSGEIPLFKHSSSCEPFQGNLFVPPCPDPNGASATAAPLWPNENGSDGRNSKLKSYIIASTVSTSVIVSFLLILVLVLVLGRKRTRTRTAATVSSTKTKVVVTFTDTPPELNYENLVKATGNFSIRNLIGMGGFGSTYKAELVPGFLVAIKRLSIGKFQGLQQFDAEIRTLGGVRHKNLVTLIGYYMGEIDTFLIYNFLSGGNLENFIHDQSGKNARWPVIHKIALDVAQALAYLHYSCNPRIVHRDIKPSNILLDEKLNAYLSDFGLAKLLEVSETHATTDVAGTFGYVAPEYATTCRVTDKSDVYSFGVVLLEMMSGKRSLDPSFSEFGNGFNIVTWAAMLNREGRSSEFFLPALWEAGPRSNLTETLKLASSCTVESLACRPSMKQVVNKLKQLKNY